MLRAFRNNYPLLTRIVFYVFCVTALVSGVSVGLQLFLTYTSEIEQLDRSLEDLKHSQLQTLANSMWNMDTNAIDIQLRGILEHPAIVYVLLADTLGTTMEYGNRPDMTTDLIVRDLRIEKLFGENQEHMGTLQIIATTSHIREQLLAGASKILGAQLATLFIACFSILFLFIRLFNRHINRIVHYTETLKIGQLDQELRLARRLPPSAGKDELDRIVDSLNNMRLRLQSEIEAQRQTQRRLIDEKLLSDTLINSLPGILFVLDSRMQPVRFNNNFLDKLGMQQGQLPGYDIYSRVPDAYRHLAEEAVREVLSKGTQRSLELPLINQRGTKTPYLITIVSIQLAGENHLIGIGTDLSEQKHIEGQLRQAQKMEAIGTLAGGIAHDFNNILSALMGYNQLATMVTVNNAKAQKYLQEAGKASERARDLVNQILSFSRKAEGDSHPIQLGPIAKEALKLLRSTIPSFIIIRQDISAQSHIQANATEVHQIIMNLCTNAYHAMLPDGGIMAVTLRDRTVSEDETFLEHALTPGDYVELTVSDTGVGMDAAVREKIFEPYFTTKSAGSGTGLGLAVVHGIVRKLQGTISVSSQPGEGTTFAVLLPVTSKPSALLSARENSLSPDFGGSERLLIVDDNPAILDFYRELLESYSYKVVTCNNPQTALDLFARDPNGFDLVLSDLTMPGFSGEKLGQQLLAIRPDLPILLSSGYSKDHTVTDWKNRGFVDFIQKPADAHDLLLRLRNIFTKRPKAN